MTDIFLLKKDKVLLGYKKRGFGKGYFVGIGGKVMGKESIKESAIRECYEETSISLSTLNSLGTVHFYFPHIEDESWNFKVYIFLAQMWKGNPKETDEINPKWFLKEEIPYNDMWDDAHYWLPYVLKGNLIKGEFLFDENLKVADYTLIL